MSTTLIGLLPMMAGAALAPVWIIVTLLLLRGERGLAKAAAFVAGVTAVRLAQGFLFGYVFHAYAAGHSDEEEGAFVAVLLLLLGIVLLVSALRKWLKDADPDEPPPRWMESITTWSPGRSFVIGVAGMSIAVKQWVFTLSALGIIGESETSVAQEVALFLLFVVGAQSLMLLVLGYTALAPAQSVQTLDAAQGWLERNNRPIAIAVSLVFGIYFLWKGIAGLAG